MVSLEQCKTYLSTCELATLTAKSFDAAMQMNSYRRRALLDAEGTSFNRLKQEEVRRRITQCLDLQPASTADLIRMVGVSQATVYKHFWGLYKITPAKFIARMNGALCGLV